jgi:hypothetical protein
MPAAARRETSSVDNLLTSRVSEGYNRQTHANVKVQAVDSLGTDFDQLLTRGALCALVAAGAWALAVVVAVGFEAYSHGRVRIATGCPVAVRVWLLAIFLAVFAGVAPANAGDTGSGPRPTGQAVDEALDGLPIPDRTVGTPRRRQPVRQPHVIVVRPGDSLWRIVRRLLPSSPDAVVADVVATVYTDNRQAIGPDPDLLTPGQRLLVRKRTTLSEES